MTPTVSHARYWQRLSTTRLRMEILAGTGGIILAVGLSLDPQRAWLDLWMGSFALVCLGLGGLFFVALQYASGAVWSIALRRVGEAMISALPAGAAGILLVLLVHPSLFPWYGHSVATEGWPGLKLAWLSYPFFVVRAFIYFAVWLGFAWAIRKTSTEQDHRGGMELSRRNTRLSVTFMVAFAITFWLASTDWVMTLEPQWASTIFGIYNFSGMFVAGLAVIALLTIAFREAGPLRGTVTDAHLLDIGRLLQAFATFWAYIWFSQYMLIWYTNFNEETIYYMMRTRPGWVSLFVANTILNWPLPFLMLLPRANKMNPRTLAAGAIVLLLGRITDLYLMIVAPFFPSTSAPVLWDFAVLGLVAGAFVLLTLRTFFQAEPVPIGDPLLPESVHGHA